MSTKLNEEGGSNLRCVTLSHLSNFALLLLDEKVRRRSFVQQRTVGKNSFEKVPFTHWGKNPHFIQKIHILKIPFFFLQNSHIENLIFFTKFTNQKSHFSQIHKSKISFFTKFTSQKSHFPQNSHFKNLIFHKIHIVKVSIFTKFTIFKHQIIGNFAAILRPISEGFQLLCRAVDLLELRSEALKHVMNV